MLRGPVPVLINLARPGSVEDDSRPAEGQHGSALGWMLKRQPAERERLFQSAAEPQPERPNPVAWTTTPTRWSREHIPGGFGIGCPPVQSPDC